MKIMNLVVPVVFLAAVSAVQGDDVLVNPKRTFLRACPSDTGGLAPLIVTLADQGITSGSTIRLEQIGDARVGFSAPYNEDTWSKGLIGAFSSSTTIAGVSTLNRVVDALDAGVDVTTPDGCEGNTPSYDTDVSYDFYIAGPNSQRMPLSTPYTDVLVPAGAVYLVVCMYDSFYGDNSDPDGDFLLRITPNVCRGDWNNSGGVSVQDIFDFEADYFAGDGDFNQVGGTTVQDLFDFLAAYFAGCP